MASKTTIQASIDHIFLAAMELFREQGYGGTNIRQIAEKAGVSLGLVNHYFGSKRELGYAVLETLIRYVSIRTEELLPPEPEKMLLLDATETRAVNTFLIHGPFRRFYLDTLREDIFFSYLDHRSDFLVEQLQGKYGYSITKDMALLYSHYIPYMLEKTLVLKKEDGLFPSIEEDEIPYHIFISSYTGRIPQQVLDECDQKARVLAPQIVAGLSPAPSGEQLAALGLLPLKLGEKKELAL